jgi:IS30 family transposase
MMAKRKKLTPAEIEKIGELRERNWTHAAIATEIGCSEGSVSWCCLREGFEPSKPYPLASGRPAAPYQRSTGTVRPFTEEDDARLLAMEADGATESEIAKALGRRHNSIRGRLMTLARRAERQEAA